MHTRTVVFKRVAQTVFDFALITLIFHVNEVDHHQAAQVAQAQLARDFFSRFQIGAKGSFFDVVAARGARGVHIHRHQGLRVVDDDCAA